MQCVKRLVAGLIVLLGSTVLAQAAPTPLTISNIPMTLVQPTPPQVLLAVTNSQSMDGDLSGAIMTGSGAVSGFSGPSSPTCYTVPAGFTPPLSGKGTGGCSSTQAPYTANNSNGTPADNSASRLNVAKAALKQVIDTYAASFDLGLMDYSTSGTSRYRTWVYYMSLGGGFTFSSANTTPPVGTGGSTGEWIANPCYKSTSNACQYISSQLGSTATSDPYMAIQTSSDNASINDVLYANGSYSSIFLDFGGHSPSNPYTYYSLSSYESGNVWVSYDHCTGTCIRTTGPTNAGFVPYSDQVMYAERGFGYYVQSVTANTGNLLVPITNAGTGSTAPTTNQLNTYKAQFTPFLQPETKQSSTSEIKALAYQSPVAGILNGALKYFKGTLNDYSAPSSPNGCTAKKYVVMVTDGLPTMDLNGNNWPPLGSAAGNGYGVYAKFDLVGGGTVSTTDSSFKNDVLNGQTLGLAMNSSGNYETNDAALIDAIEKLKALDSAGVKTYIVGMGAGVDPTKNPAAAATLKAMAIAGGTTSYFKGTSAKAVVQDLQVVFGQIQAANMSTTAVAVNSGSIQANTQVYQARFTSDTSPYSDWTGNLYSFPVGSDLNVNTSSSKATWQLAGQLDSLLAGTGWQSFPELTWNDSTNTGVGFSWSAISSSQQQALDQYWSQLTSTAQSDFKNSQGTPSQTVYGQAVLDYIAGDRSNAQAQGGIFRNRSLLLGDIVDSNPVYVGAPPATSALSGLSTSSPYETAYSSFVTANSGRTPMIYVGSNNGMVYGVNATTGEPVFSFVPAGLYGDLYNLTLPSYNSQHKFYADGSPVAADVPFTTSNGKVSWHTILVGGLNDGGKGIYALDVTNPEADIKNAPGNSQTPTQALAQNVLWSITNSTPGFSQLGLTYSVPQVAIMDINNSNGTPVPTPVVIFGNGYNSANGLPYLYVVNAQTGAIIHTFDLCSQSSGIEPLACNTSVTNGLSTVTVVSIQGNGFADRAYAGDLQGNLWRFDLSSPNPNNWTANVLFKAVGPNGLAQPITTAPAVSYAPNGTAGLMVYFGTGQLLGAPDIANTNTQSFYGVLDTGTNTGVTTSSTNPQWLVRGDLQSQVVNTTTYTYTTSGGATATKNVRTITTNPVNYASKSGWYFDFPIAGERLITDPTVFGQEVVFTTNVPATNVCGAGMQSWLMAVNFATGGAFSGPQLDLNGDGLINASDQVNGSNPVGVDLGSVYASGPVITPVSNQGSPNNPGSVKLISTSNSQVLSVKEKAGLTSGRVTWVELR